MIDKGIQAMSSQIGDGFYGGWIAFESVFVHVQRTLRYGWFQQAPTQWIAAAGNKHARNQDEVDQLEEHVLLGNAITHVTALQCCKLRSLQHFLFRHTITASSPSSVPVNEPFTSKAPFGRLGQSSVVFKPMATGRWMSVEA
ncbi:MAG: hypothetical protein Ct9H90mP16_06590 [Candidatus Poseidoniales archaeon]|nr:MAG: hypothetical protein Ct9H90mP16_06590 [Candidatus Poseidoniales archaeon]